MSGQHVEFGWFIPTSGDGRYIGVKPEREPSLDYFVEVAQTAEAAGFEFALIPTGHQCIDAWVVGSAVAAHTKTLKPLVAMRPGLIAPVLAARMASSLDVISGGRALINVVTGGSPDDLRATGDPLFSNHDGRYERTLEFLNIVKDSWTKSHDFSLAEYVKSGGQSGTNFKGKYYEVEGGLNLPAPVQQPHPPLYFGGSSPAGKRVAAETADVYLLWAETLDMIKEQIADVERHLADVNRKQGSQRTLRYGLRAQIVVRETEQEAWKAAWNIISKVDPQASAVSEFVQSRSDATNQQRQTALWKDSEANGYIIGPNLWSGLARVRGGGAVTFVGTPAQVSDRLLEFIDAGISTFVLSGYPHVEEAQIAGEHLLPLVKAKLAAREVKVVV
ncbi:F420-dependent oxidoreductase [Paenibacillus swuensis]|uniref:F420-dependent oxidoreductase n=1 Tax=Paenibacillus swuensis TaxID=1178515 RepID=A0A172TJW6_9BACL|nr:LLM class flavin-dependent oxidoreductase [Paenibacillus swuensis]ANE47127.1 F420-dependent oxidoreductase [Paenibacillus swuensis]